MDFLNHPPPDQKPSRTTAAFSKLRRIPSFKRSKSTSKSKKEDRHNYNNNHDLNPSKPKSTKPSPPPNTRRVTGTTPPPLPYSQPSSAQQPEPSKSKSKLSQLKSRFSNLLSPPSSSSKPTSLTSTPSSTPPKPSLQIPTPPPPPSPIPPPSPTPSSSPAQSFHTTYSTLSLPEPPTPPPISPPTPPTPSPISPPELVPIPPPPSDIISISSVASTDAIYQHSNPTKFWNNIHKRNERKRLAAERLKEASKGVSVCERIRRDRFSRKKVVVEEGEEGDRVYVDHEVDDDDVEDMGEEEEGAAYIGFNWVKKLEERYYGLDERDSSSKVDVNEDVNVEDTTQQDDGEDNDQERTHTYWEKMDELRRAVANAVVDMALKPSGWGKVVD
ncbi:hypothetical protein TWF506_007587 [Arthrobotrys conoides]|uniref:Uncharacterized protein n=1 Tax=Arthrobotrys conoides TaxID=74498 RepID=A0AAN8PI42_9PEZI